MKRITQLFTGLSRSKIDLFRPEFFLLAYLVYILVAFYSFRKGFIYLPVSELSFLIPIFSFAPFLMGAWLGKRFYGRSLSPILLLIIMPLAVLFYSLVLTGVYQTDLSLNFILIAPIAMLLLYKAHKTLKNSVMPPKLSALICSGGLFFILLSFREVGVPIFDSALRPVLTHNAFFGAGLVLFLFGFVPLLQKIGSKKTFFLALILPTLFFLLTALRWVVLFVFLTAVFMAYYRGFLDLKKILPALIAAAVIILYVGSFVHQGGQPVQLFFERIGETHSTFSEIVDQSYPLGDTKGALFFNGNPRDFVAMEVFKYPANLTYTVLGAPMLEFGVAGVFAFMLLLGMLLTLAYENMKEKGMFWYYPLLLAISLVWLEIGVDQLSMLFFAFFAVFYLLKYSDI